MKYELVGNYSGVNVSFGTFCNRTDCYKKIAEEGNGRQLFVILEITKTPVERLTAKQARQKLEKVKGVVF